MDVKLLAELHAKYDTEFAETHPMFVRWWAKHKHNDPDPKYAIAPRIAFKCACFYDEYQEAKTIGVV